MVPAAGAGIIHARARAAGAAPLAFAPHGANLNHARAIDGEEEEGSHGHGHVILMCGCENRQTETLAKTRPVPPPPPLPVRQGLTCTRCERGMDPDSRGEAARRAAGGAMPCRAMIIHIPYPSAAAVRASRAGEGGDDSDENAGTVERAPVQPRPRS